MRASHQQRPKPFSSFYHGTQYLEGLIGDTLLQQDVLVLQGCSLCGIY
jgi:hypothetical protein